MQKERPNVISPAGERAKGEWAFPASFAQQRLWFLDQLEPDSPLYNLPVTLRLSGRLDLPAFRRALDEIVTRHEVLRTTFAMRDGRLMQLVSPPPAALPCPVVELPQTPPERLEAVARGIAEEDALRPFDLARGPLLRARLLRFCEDEHVLVMTMHHIVSDEWSLNIFTDELSRLYAAFSRGQESPLGPLPVQYADYAVWQRGRLQGEELEEHLDYWCEQLGGGRLPVLEIGRGRPAEATRRGGCESADFGDDLRQSLKRRCRELGVTPFMLLLAVWDVLLYRYTGEGDVVVGTPIANRTHAEVEGLIGFFVNTLVLRAKVEPGQTFREFLRHVWEVALGAYEHQEAPFDKLVEVLQPERSASHLPLFQVTFMLQYAPKSAADQGGLTIRPMGILVDVEKADLSLGVRELDGGLRVGINYRRDLFDGALIRQMVGHYGNLLKAVLLDPGRRISDLPLFDEGELRRVLSDWNDTAGEYPEGLCAHHLFEASAARTPATTALVFGGERVTYAELNGGANRIAHYLRGAGVGPETRVAVMLGRGVTMIESVLAVLKAGGAYVPLDPQLPAERLSYMLKDSGAKILLTERELAERPGDVGDARVVCLDLERERLSAESAANPDGGATTDGLAYVIYTSGSTGRPKGVMVAHRGLCNTAAALSKIFGLGAEDRVLQFFSLGFDASVFEILAALTAGGSLCLAPRETFLQGSDFVELLRDQRVTFGVLPPSLLAVLPDADLPALKTLCVGGEACPAEVAARWSEGRRFFNIYGPTECTIWSVLSEYAGGGQKPLIGRPLLNTRAYLLDADLNPVPVGAAGELYLAGVGLARGYLNRPGLTAERFIPNPFGASEGSRLYRTGDLARHLPDGQIDFLGRVDRQVKIRGYRIEMGEIEAVMATHPSVRRAAVFEREAPNGEKRLVAYLLARGGAAPETVELRDYLTGRLPGYMVPAAFVSVESFPLTVNGKIDDAALPEPEWSAAERETGRVAPRNTREEALVEMWEGLLGTKGLGVYDNFFEAGGNSLLMMQAIAQAKEAFDVNLPVAAFYESPTAAAVAEVILKLWRAPLLEEASEVFGEARHRAQPATVFPLQPAGSRPPFFCVHPVGGHLGDYRELARELGAYEQPVYGLQAWGLDDDAEPHARVEDMAAPYAEAILGTQPRGPFRVGGYCSGGVIAVELARELRRRGHEVSVLALIGPQAALSDAAPGEEALREFELFSSVFFCDELKITVTAEALRPLGAAERMEKIWEEFCRQSPLDSARLGSALFRRLYKVYMANIGATMNYVPRPYDGPVAVFESEEQQQAKPAPASAWEKLCRGPLGRHRVGGNHITLMRQPHVRELAEKLNACLNGEMKRSVSGD